MPIRNEYKRNNKNPGTPSIPTDSIMIITGKEKTRNRRFELGIDMPVNWYTKFPIDPNEGPDSVYAEKNMNSMINDHKRPEKK